MKIGSSKTTERDEHPQHERVVVLRPQLDVELVGVEVREEVDRGRQRDEVRKEQSAKEEDCEGGEAEDDPLRVLVEGGREEAPAAARG